MRKWLDMARRHVVLRIAICYVVIMFTLLSAGAGMDLLQEHNLFSALSGFSVAEIRGLQREAPPERLQIELNRLNVDELRRRVETIEGQRSEVRMAVIEAKLDTLFELTRVLIGAAIVYCVQVIGSLVSYFGGRKRRTGEADA